MQRLTRYLAIFLTISIVVCFAVIPVSADTLGGTRFNLFDTGTPDDTGTYSAFIGPTEHIVDFPLLFPTPIRYVDFIFQTDVMITDVYVTDGIVSTLLTVTNLDGKTYRVTGECDFGLTGNVALLFTDLTESGYITFTSAYAYSDLTETAVINALAVISWGEQSISGDYFGQGVTLPILLTPEDYISHSAFSAMIELGRQWMGYDFVDIVMAMTVSSVDSISAFYFMDGQQYVIPVETSRVEEANGSALPTYAVNCRLDLSGVPRTGFNDVFIGFAVTGTFGPEQRGTNFITLASVLGGNIPQDFNVLGHWFSRIVTTLENTYTYIRNQLMNAISQIPGNIVQLKNDMVSNFTKWGNNITTTLDTWGQNIVNALLGTGDTDGFREEVDKVKDEMENASDAMNDFTRPSVDDVLPDIGNYVDTDDNNVSELFTTYLFGDETIYSLTFIGVAVWLIGLVVGV